MRVAITQVDHFESRELLNLLRLKRIKFVSNRDV